VLPRAAVVLLVAAAAVSGCGDDPAGDYGADTRESFLTACVEDDADAALAGVCECTYERLVDDVPYERFVEIEQAVEEGGELPPEVVAIIDDCIDEVSREQG
jgi:hypothetical protein